MYAYIYILRTGTLYSHSKGYFSKEGKKKITVCPSDFWHPSKFNVGVMFLSFRKSRPFHEWLTVKKSDKGRKKEKEEEEK